MEKSKITKSLAVFASVLLIIIIGVASFAYFGTFNVNLNNNVAVNINSSSPGNATFASNATQLNLQVPAANMSFTVANNTVAAKEDTAFLDVTLTGSSNLLTTCTYDIVYEYDAGSNVYGQGTTTKTSGATKEITIEVNGMNGNNHFATETNFDHANIQSYYDSANNYYKLVEGATIKSLGSTQSVRWKIIGRYYNLNVSQAQLGGKNFTGKIYAISKGCSSEDGSSVKKGYETILVNNGGKTAIEAKAAPSFANIETGNAGMYSYTEGTGKTYYYRGAVDNNWVKYGKFKEDELKGIEEKLIKHNGKVKYLTVTGASNVTGYINDIYKIAEIVHKYNCKIIVDGAQLVPHKEISISGKGKNQNIDFLVFSAHKFYAPFGSGAIIGLKEEFEKNKPFFEGGGTVNYVMDYGVEYLLPPEKNEAGTPNYFGVVAMNLALEELKKIGLSKIENKECMLKDRMINGLKSIPRVKIYGDTNKYNDSLGIIVFNIGSLYHQIVAEDLAKKYGISVRQGWFCSHPYCRRIMHMSEKTASAFMHDPSIRMPGMIRISFGMYNNVNEVDYFLNAIEDIERFYR